MRLKGARFNLNGTGVRIREGITLPSIDQQQQKSDANLRAESDLSLEGVILLIFGVFMSLFGVLLFKIHTGALPYAPDSLYGLFLVLVSIQTLTVGKTPLGDLRRSRRVILIGIGTAVIGMTACFIPGPLTGGVRILAGLLLVVRGVSLLFPLVVSEEKAKMWMKGPGILQHLTLAALLVYGLSIVLGLVTLFPGLTTSLQTAVLLIVYGISFFYLAWSLQRVRRRYPSESSRTSASVPVALDTSGLKSGFPWLRETPLPLSLALLILMAVLLTLLGFLLVPVTLGLLPFSPDGQFGLLLVIMAVQMMAAGETPLGHYKRSWLIILIGIGFAALGIFSSIVPGILTGRIQMLLGLLNILGGVILLIMRFLPLLHERRPVATGASAVLPLLKKILIIQTVLNLVGIAFGLSMFLPGFVPGQVVAGILIIYGLLLFALASILPKIDQIAQNESL